MARTQGATSIRTLEFIRKYESLASEYVDPCELLFQIAAASKKIGKPWERSHRLQAASTLMQYRYPRLKAMELSAGDDTPTVQISWLDEDSLPIPPQPVQSDLLN